MVPGHRDAFFSGGGVARGAATAAPGLPAGWELLPVQFGAPEGEAAACAAAFSVAVASVADAGKGEKVGGLWVGTNGVRSDG